MMGKRRLKNFFANNNAQSVCKTQLQQPTTIAGLAYNAWYNKKVLFSGNRLTTT